MATYLPNVTDVLPQPALYTPDYSFLDSMLRRRQGLYEQGFAQVSNAYNFVNRNVTNPYSMNVRDQFLAQARNNLKNIAAMDLSQQQNVETARAVFDPFVKNQPVLMDMAFTAHLDQQESIAESYRLKDGGKEFSEDNLNYVRKQRAAFANDDISSVGKYYSNRRSFTPYYDWNKEFKDWFASYKPDKISIDTKDGLYKVTEERGGATAQDLKLFFSSVASEKAKNQMRIEATVRLADNPEQLAGVYADIAIKDIDTINDKISSVDNQIKLTKDKEEIAALKQQKQVLEDQKFKLSSNVDKISNGDIGFIKNNAETLAFGIYFDQAVSRISKGLSWTEYKKSFSADEVALAIWKEAQADARQARSDARADRRALWELEGLPGGPGNAITLTADETALLGKKSYDDTLVELDGIKESKVKNSKAMTLHVANQLGKDPNKITEQDMRDYANSNRGKRDEVYIRYKGAMLDLEADERIVQSQIESAKKSAEKKVGKDLVTKAKQDFKTKSSGSVGGFSADEIFDAVMNGNYRLPASQPIGASIYTAGTQTFSSDFIINGKKVSNSLDAKTYNAVYKMVTAAEKSLKDVKGAYKEGLQSYFQNSSVLNKRAFPLNQTTKYYKTTAGTIGGIAGIDDGSIKQIMLGGNNDAFFYVDNEVTRKGGEERDKYFKNIETKLKFQGLEAKYDAKAGLMYIKEKPGYSSVRLGLDFYQNYTPLEKKIVAYGETQAGNGWMSTPFYPNNLTLDKKGNPLPSYQFKVATVDDQRMYYLYAQDEQTPIASKSSLTDLIDDAKRTQSFLYEKGYRPE